MEKRKREEAAKLEKERLAQQQRELEAEQNQEQVDEGAVEGVHDTAGAQDHVEIDNAPDDASIAALENEPMSAAKGAKRKASSMNSLPSPLQR